MKSPPYPNTQYVYGIPVQAEIMVCEVNPLPKHNRYTSGWNHVTNGGLWSYLKHNRYIHLNTIQACCLWSHFHIMLLMVCEVVQFNTGWPLKKDSLGGAENFNLPILTSGKSFCQMKAFGLCPTGLMRTLDVLSMRMYRLVSDFYIMTEKYVLFWPHDLLIIILCLFAFTCSQEVAVIPIKGGV